MRNHDPRIPLIQSNLQIVKITSLIPLNIILKSHK